MNTAGTKPGAVERAAGGDEAMIIFTESNRASADGVWSRESTGARRCEGGGNGRDARVRTSRRL